MWPSQAPRLAQHQGEPTSCWRGVPVTWSLVSPLLECAPRESHVLCSLSGAASPEPRTLPTPDVLLKECVLNVWARRPECFSLESRPLSHAVVARHPSRAWPQEVPLTHLLPEALCRPHWGSARHTDHAGYSGQLFWTGRCGRLASSRNNVLNAINFPFNPLSTEPFQTETFYHRPSASPEGVKDGVGAPGVSLDVGGFQEAQAPSSLQPGPVTVGEWLPP